MTDTTQAWLESMGQILVNNAVIASNIEMMQAAALPQNIGIPVALMVAQAEEEPQ